MPDQEEVEDVQEETQEQDTQNPSGDEKEDETVSEDETQVADGGPPTKKRKIRNDLSREPGKSLLPFARVQKIVKADKEIPLVAREAIFLISLATEEFIKRFCEAAQKIAECEKRATVQHRDIATVVRKADEFLFLDELIPWTAPDPPPKRQIGKPRDAKAGVGAAATLLDQFVTTGKKNDDKSQDDSVVVSEDGEDS